VKTNFGSLTLCSHKEKVGSIFYLLLALHDRRGREIFQKAHKRQQTKYLTFPSESAVSALNLKAKKKKSLSSLKAKAKKKQKLSATKMAHQVDKDDAESIHESSDEAEEPEEEQLL